MNKIPTIFERDWDGDRSRVLDTPSPGCEWVFDGEGKATRKYDGTCVMFDGTDWWARREVKAGKTPPAGFVSLEHDHTTGKAMGWEPVEQSPFAKFHAEALLLRPEGTICPEGTYELCGPKVQGNPEHFETHALIRHADAETMHLADRSFTVIKNALTGLNWEGFVFHHEDGRMAKIKGRDLGLRRN